MNTPAPDWAYRAAEEIVATATGDDDYAASIIAEHWMRDTQTLRCAFCGAAHPPGTPDSQHDLLSAHIRVCERHPMREVEAESARLRAALQAIADHDSGAWAAGKHRSDAIECAYHDVLDIAFKALNPPATPEGRP